MGIAKLLFIGINSTIVVFGGVLVTMSLLFMADRTTAREMISRIIQDPDLVDTVIKIGTNISVITFLTGLILTVVSGLGCMGAMNANISMLNAYMACAVVLIVVTVSSMIAFGVNKSKVLKRAYDHLEVKLKSGYDGNYEDISPMTILIDSLQIYFDCCGIYTHEEFDGASNWVNRTFGPYSDLTYPITCCAWNKSKEKSFDGIDEESFQDPETCLKHSSEDNSFDPNALSSASNFNTPCKQKIDKFATERMGMVFAIASIAFVVQFTSLFIAYLFKRKAEEEQ